jgi:predicted O-methyltransferase YrrM
MPLVRVPQKKGRRVPISLGRLAYLLRSAISFYQIQHINWNSGLGHSAWILYSLVRAKKPQVCVEIGSARGRSASFIGLALRDNGKGMLYAIDPHLQTPWNDPDSRDTFIEMRKNLAAVGVQGFVRVIRDWSGAVASSWNRPIDILFIDGDHSYEGVKRDWEAFLPHMAPFGIVVFHDTIWNIQASAPKDYPNIGVPRFVEELRQQGYPVLTLENDHGVSLVQPELGGVRLVPAP